MSDAGQHKGNATRREIASAAAEGLIRANLTSRRALVGFDGFIDLIMDLVDVRADMTPTGYRPIQTIGALATRVGAAAGKSANIEVVTRERRWGGNGPLLAGGVARLGVRTEYIGAVGREGDCRALDPTFVPFVSLCERVIPVASPGRTDAMEFADGKVMLNHCSSVQDVTWERVVEVVGLDVIRGMVARADLIGIVNWSLLGGVNGIWRGLIRDVLPAIGAGAGSKRPRVFIDLSDPAKRTDGDLRDGLGLLRELNGHAPVTLGLNLAESERIERVARVGGVAVVGERAGTLAERLVRVARALRESLGLDCVVIHPREGAAGADASGSTWFDGPMTQSPKISTGAGDHFNAGFAAAQIGGLPLEQCLAAGTALSGAYVRDGTGPTLERLCEFLRALPEPDV